MTDPDETITGINDVDALLERLLAGDDPGRDAPPWAGNLALLVRAAQAPPRPDELAGEDDIVRRMTEARLAALAGTGPAVPAVPEPAALASVTHLGDHRARHGLDRTYRAKHAAARLEASRHPAVRTLGRVIAMKAAAVTTAAVIGVAAAAAATTGIVATVVVPALSSNEPRKADPPPVSTERPQRPGTTQGVGEDAPSWPDELLPLGGCPLLPACATPPDPAGTTQPAASTTVPSTTPTTLAAEGTTPPETTTTVPEPVATTTVPEPTTTVPEPPTTTTIPENPPDPLVTAMSAQEEAAPGGSTTSAPADAP